uniref:RNase NYN domain-containing protein n=1 Tax=Neospora caninum (strain Liverpool) TaxID=572307 RepID=A0A0F7UKM4_NEOCL|nr:TPA: hypothetical protein BN1204_047760 [Neospora caninum Liverpool]
MLRRRGRTLAGGRRRGNQEREGQIEQGDQDEGGETGTALAECLTLCSEGPARGTKGDGTATVSAGPIQGVGPPRWGRHLKKEEKGEAGSLVRSRAATKTGHARSAGDAFKDDCLNDEDLELLLKSGAFFDTPPRDGEAAFMNDGQLRLMLRPETTARGRRDEGWPLRAADVEEQWTFLEKEEGSNGETGEGHSLGEDEKALKGTARNRRGRQGDERETASARRQGAHQEKTLFLGTEPPQNDLHNEIRRGRRSSALHKDEAEGSLWSRGESQHACEGLWRTQTPTTKARSRRQGDTSRRVVTCPRKREENRHETATAPSVSASAAYQAQNASFSSKEAALEGPRDLGGERRSASKRGDRERTPVRRSSVSSRSCESCLSEAAGDCDFQSALSDLGEASDGRLGAEVENENREGWPEGSARILGKQGRSHGVKGRAKRDTFSKDDLQKRRAGDGGGVAGRDSGEGAPLQVLIQQRWDAREEQEERESENRNVSRREGWLPAAKFSRRSQRLAGPPQAPCAARSASSLPAESEKARKESRKERAETAPASGRKPRFCWPSSSSSDEEGRTSSSDSSERGRTRDSCSSPRGKRRPTRTAHLPFSAGTPSRDRDTGAEGDWEASLVLLWRVWPTPDFPVSPARDSAKGLTPLLLDGASIAFEHGRQRRLSPLGVSFAVARVFELGLPAKVLLPFWLAGEEHFYPTFFLGNAKGVALWQQVRQGLQEDSMLVVLPDPNAHLPEESHARWYPTRDCFKSLSDALEIARLCKQWGAALCSNDFEQFLRLVVGQKNKKMAEIYDFVSRSSVLLAFHKNEMHLILDSQGRGSSVETLILRTGKK